MNTTQTKKSSTNIQIQKLFQEANAIFESENEIKKKLSNEINNLEAIIRNIHTIVQQVFSSNQDEVKEMMESSQKEFEKTRAIFLEIDKLIDQSSFYRFNRLWSDKSTQLCYLATLRHYIATGELNSLDQINNLLGVDKLNNFSITLEEYLHGLCSISSDLSRLAVNSVTRGDFNQPFIIRQFLVDLYGAFLQLNLKNDTLRRKFDAIKYDKKKVEDVIYDISIRGLNKQKNQESSTAQNQE